MSTTTSLQKISPALLVAIKKGGTSSLQLFAKDILVLQCIVAGTSFTKTNNFKTQLQLQDEVTLVRESKNKYDDMAIQLQWKSKKIGYIPRDQNQVIARLMDAGKQFKAILTNIELNYVELSVDIYLKD
jgi:hypothetical protein